MPGASIPSAPACGRSSTCSPSGSPSTSTGARRAPGSAATPPGAPEPADPAETERTLLALEVREALDALGDNHREVLELGYRGELTQREIAARLDLPLGTVKSRTYHALRALRRELDLRGLDG